MKLVSIQSRRELKELYKIKDGSGNKEVIPGKKADCFQEMARAYQADYLSAGEMIPD